MFNPRNPELTVRGVTFTVPKASAGIRVTKFVRSHLIAKRDEDGNVDSETTAVIYSALLCVCLKDSTKRPKRIRKMEDQALIALGDSFLEDLSDEFDFTLRDILLSAQWLLEAIMDVSKDDDKAGEESADFLEPTP